MPKITLNNKSEEVPEGKNPYETFEKLGMEFGCHNGICGTCKTKVKKGMENINPKTEEEEEFPLDDDERLGCQCHRLKGDIEVEYVEW
ncbi:ferredoxin [Candidatus Pacearchaeota archaeon CG_4_9_14_0_2_um_filter_30_8]|nr:MAG: ferredoxin [Candidatus Pacearchaeota archaeon CG_4_9_14_0_2_um_filter_30_8]